MTKRYLFLIYIAKQKKLARAREMCHRKYMKENKANKPTAKECLKKFIM